MGWVILMVTNQVVRAKEVLDLHTLVEGFGFTMEGKALKWFQTLNIPFYTTFEVLAK